METCPYCNRSFSSITSRHKAVCDGWPKPDKPEPCLCGHESTSLTQMKRHRAKCEVWLSRDADGVKRSRMRATSLARYGVEHANQTEEVRARVAATNLERYGATNPFNREASTFDKVQASLDGKRPVLKGADNPFSREDVKAKVRDHWVNEHGVTNPQQVAEIRARTRATTVERYGGEMMGSPVLAERARETNVERYGDAVPQRTDAVKDRQRETNLLRHGVPWTGMSPEVRAKQLATHHARYGSYWFASDEGKATIRAALVERYGVEHPSHMEGWWERVVATNRERYGVPYPVMLGRFRDGPNNLEKTVMSMAPEGILRFTGDGGYWRFLPLLGRHKNPDFVVVSPDCDPEHPFRGSTKVIEAFGDFWHSKMFTGKVPFEHERELIEAYADAGLECLVIWESEIEDDPVGVRGRIESFVSAP
jgi:hypothetical protein